MHGKEKSTKSPTPREVPIPGLFVRLIIYYLGLLQEFLRSTALNGFKYLAFSYLTFWEKLFFFICIIAATYNSLNFGINIIEKWQTSPVLIVMNPEATFVITEPFPAVTICNMNQASKRKVKDYPVDSTDYVMLQKLCFEDLNYTTYSKSEYHRTNDTHANFIIRSTQTCSELIQVCQWGFEMLSCTDLFREVLLDEGICCSFNIVHPFLLYKGDYFMVRDFTSITSHWIPVDWNPETGYAKDLPNSFYPRLAWGEGTSNGLTLILNGDIDDYYCTSTNGPGFKLQIHHVLDAPFIKDTGLPVSLGSQTSFRINVIKDEAEPSLRSISPIDRGCYFSDERPLHYYRYYTRRNCEAECDASYILRTCMCIPYYMPMIVANATVCYVEHFDCLDNAERDFSDPEKLSCKSLCLSGCHDLTYMPNIFTTRMATEDFNLDHEFLRNLSSEYIRNNMALVNIYYPLNYYRSYVKTPYTGTTEYLSQTGGIMSLMLGFSVISVIECVYFFVIKPLMALWVRCFSKNIKNIQQLSLNANDKEKL